MNRLKSFSGAVLALSLFASSSAVVFADEQEQDIPNSRLERLNARNAKIRGRVVHNSKSQRADFGFGARRAGLNDIRETQSQRRKTQSEYRRVVRRPSLRALHSNPVSRSRAGRYESGDRYENRLKKGLSVCSERHVGRYERNNCIRKFTRGTRTFE